MPVYECYVRGSELIEAETPQEATAAYLEMLTSEPETALCALELENE